MRPNRRYSKVVAEDPKSILDWMEGSARFRTEYQLSELTDPMEWIGRYAVIVFPSRLPHGRRIIQCYTIEFNARGERIPGRSVDFRTVLGLPPPGELTPTDPSMTTRAAGDVIHPVARHKRNMLAGSAWAPRRRVASSTMADPPTRGHGVRRESSPCTVPWRRAK